MSKKLSGAEYRKRRLEKSHAENLELKKVKKLSTYFSRDTSVVAVSQEPTCSSKVPTSDEDLEQTPVGLPEDAEDHAFLQEPFSKVGLVKAEDALVLVHWVCLTRSNNNLPCVVNNLHHPPVSALQSIYRQTRASFFSTAIWIACHHKNHTVPDICV
ncbi:hypothetical protein J6590_052303 [Homalodisca vitripennis]|nr:hypothetical protein J6590_052303 [Homalodisca vitripennis]